MQRTAADLSWVAPNLEERVHGREIKALHRPAEASGHARYWQLYWNSKAAHNGQSQMTKTGAVMTLLIAVMMCGSFAAADAPQTTSTSAKGSVCVAPLPSWPPETSAPDVPQCGSGNFSIKIDDRAPVDWPQKESAKLDPLDMSPRHRVIILCDKRPNQSFTFRFSAYDEPNLCLFINDFYSTLQLWERKRAPWCKCDAAAPRK